MTSPDWGLENDGPRVTGPERWSGSTCAMLLVSGSGHTEIIITPSNVDTVFVVVLKIMIVFQDN